MKTQRARYNLSGFPIIAFAAIALMSCGGGGGGSAGISGPAGGPAAVEFAIGTGTGTAGRAPVSPSATVDDPAFRCASQFPSIAHVCMDIRKVTLMPATEPGFDSEDMDGEIRDGDGPPDPSSPPDKSGYVTVVPNDAPRIDLLSAEKDKTLARILNLFDGVPAGVYDKIRVHYGNAAVTLADGTAIPFHPTARSHFDIRFVQGGELVIPAAIGPAESPGGIRLFKVKLDVLGLKIRIVRQGNGWKGTRAVLRPQIFARFVSPMLYRITGTVSAVGADDGPDSGTFDVDANGTAIAASFGDDTCWAFSDDVLNGSSWVVSVPRSTGSRSLRDRAAVEAVGRFDPASRRFIAGEITVTFPDALAGTVDAGWTSGNTFRMRNGGGDVVAPMPDRYAAVYDNLAPPHAALTQSAVAANATVRARGYRSAAGIEASWVSCEGGSAASSPAAMLFSATDGTNGKELWATDGTPAGTRRVADINPAGDSYPQGATVFGGAVYFTADDGTHGYELWRTDGTPAGTRMVADVNPAGDSLPGGLTSFRGALYFSADDGAAGFELWKTDGTAAGTQRVADINPAGDSSPGGMTVFNGALYFSADDGANGKELWTTDGTAAGTRMVADINSAGSSLPQRMTVLDGALYFSANDKAHGRELWKTDGTSAGTQMVADINPAGFSFPDGLTVLDGALYFSASDGVNGHELWTTDGTAAGTRMVRNINPSWDSYPQEMTVFGGALYFSADDGQNGRELWTTDGTPAGTRMVADIDPSWNSNPQGMTVFGGALYFTANDGTNGYELWKTDGSAPGTQMVGDIHPSGDAYPQGMTVFGGALYFTADDGVNGNELRATDGTAAGTRVVADINPGPAGSDASGFVVP